MQRNQETESPAASVQTGPELLPCPFCGGEAIVGAPIRYVRKEKVCCLNGTQSKCALGMASFTREQWNARATPTPTEPSVEQGLMLFRQLVSEKNALRQLDVFECSDIDHALDCECFWEQCEEWAKADAAAREFAASKEKENGRS